MNDRKHDAAYHDGKWPGDDHGPHGYHPEEKHPPKKDKKRVLPWVVGGILGLALIGQLGGEDAPADPEPTPVVEATEEPAEPTPEPTFEEPVPEVEPTLPADFQENLFLDFVRDEHSILVDVPDADLLELAENICTAYDNGAVNDDISLLIVQNSNNESEMAAFATVHGAGVAAFCPEHTDKVGA